MLKNQSKIPLIFQTLFVLLGLIMIVDFVAPGKIINTPITEIKKERQQSYNAARNYHYSYKVVTSQHEFLVSEDFAAQELANRSIAYAVSVLFKKINWYKLPQAKHKEYYSLRLVSGLILPVLTIIFILIEFKFNRRIGKINFILKALMLGNVVLLLT